MKKAAGLALRSPAGCSRGSFHERPGVVAVVSFTGRALGGPADRMAQSPVTTRLYGRPRRRNLAIAAPIFPFLGVRNGGSIGKLVGRRNEAADHLVEAIE